MKSIDMVSILVAFLFLCGSVSCQKSRDNISDSKNVPVIDIDIEDGARPILVRTDLGSPRNRPLPGLTASQVIYSDNKITLSGTPNGNISFDKNTTIYYHFDATNKVLTLSLSPGILHNR
jgi:hypothetical protein